MAACQSVQPLGQHGVQGDLLAVVLAPAVAVGVDDAGLVKKGVGAFDVIAGPLQIGHGVVVVQGLLALGGVHQRTRHVGEGGALVGHGVGDDGVIVNGHGDGLAQRGVLGQHGQVEVVPRGGHGQAHAVGRFFIVGGDRQAVFQPQVLHVADELLADVHFAGLQGVLTGGVVGVDRVGDVLRHGQLAPHGSILAPVVVVADEHDLLVVGVVLGVGAGPDDVFTGVVQDGHGVAVVALDHGVDPRGLGDGGAGQEVQNLQGG